MVNENLTAFLITYQKMMGKIEELKQYFVGILSVYSVENRTKTRVYLQAASSTDNSLARIPPILLKDGICMPYFSSSFRMLLISSSVWVQKKRNY